MYQRLSIDGSGSRMSSPEIKYFCALCKFVSISKFLLYKLQSMSKENIKPYN